MKCELFLVSRNVDAFGNIETVKTKLDYQKSMHFVLDNTIEYDSLDFQVVSEQKINFEIYDIVQMIIDDSERYAFTIIAVNERNINNTSTVYEYTINCTELTKRLEKWFLTRDFSQPTVDDLEIVRYDGYTTRLKMVEEVKKFTYFVKDENRGLMPIRIWDEIEAETYATLAKEYDTDDIPSVTANNDTVKDVLDEIFSHFGAVARLNYDIDRDKIILAAQFQNKIGAEIEFDKSKVAGYSLKKNINGYGNVANPIMQNVIGSSNLANNGINGRPFTFDSNFADTANAKIVVDYPIKEVKKLIISKLDGSDGNIDITRFVVMNNQKQFLSLVSSISGATDELYQNNTVSYNVGGYEIDGFGGEYEGLPLPFFADNSQTVFNAILKSVGVGGDLKPENIQNYKYYIEYIPITTEKVEIFKNDLTSQKYYGNIPIVPQGNNLDFKRACNTLQDLIDKTGGSTEEKTAINEWHALGDYDSGTGRIIVKKDCTLNNGTISTVYTLTNESGYFNAYNSVDSMKRESAIEASINRDIIVNDFLVVGSNPRGLKSSLTPEGVKKFASIFTRANIPSKTNNGVLIVKDLNYKLISVPILKTIGRDYAKVGFRANNPTNVGFKRLDYNNRVAVNYSQRNGVLKNLGLSYGLSDSLIKNVNYNKTLPEINKTILDTDELNSLWTGTKLINLGDVGAIDIDYELGDIIEKSVSNSISTDNSPKALTINQTFDLGGNYYPKSLKIDMSHVGDFLGTNYITYERDIKWEIYLDDNLIKNGESFGNVNVSLDQNLVGQTLRISFTGNFNIYDENFGTASGRASVAITVAVQEQLQIESDDAAKVELTVDKNPNEILGIFHALNVINTSVLSDATNYVIGEQFMTLNPLYNDNAPLGYNLYLSKEYTRDGIENMGRQFFRKNTGLNINLGDNYIGIGDGFGIPPEYKSILVYDATDTHLLFAVNGIISYEQEFISFNFTAKPNKLILE